MYCQEPDSDCLVVCSTLFAINHRISFMFTTNVQRTAEGYLAFFFVIFHVNMSTHIAYLKFKQFVNILAKIHTIQQDS